jgi:hypothetical protein
VELITNGSFESGLALWRWETSSGVGSPLTSDWATDGTQSARLGDGYDRDDQLEQSFVAPSGAERVRVSFDLRVEGPGDHGDDLYVSTRNFDNTHSMIIRYFGDELGQHAVDLEIPATQLARSRAIRFEVETDSQRLTRFLVDDVHVQVCGPGVRAPEVLYVPMAANQR